MSMKLLALDMAKRTGWAHSCGDSGVETFPHAGYGKRFAAFASWLRDMSDLYPFHRIVYEKCHHRGYHATHQGHAMIALVEWASDELGLLPPKGYHSAEIKKHATGKGNADKGAMQLAALERNPDRQFIDDNEIDALFLLDLALSDSEL